MFDIQQGLNVHVPAAAPIGGLLEELYTVSDSAIHY